MMSRQARIDRQISDIQETWGKDDIARLIDRVHYNGLISQAQDYARNQVVDFADYADKIAASRADRNKPSGIQTGIRLIDQMTYGLRPAELTVIAGPSSHGKTAVALNMAVSALEHNEGLEVLFLSLEMSVMEIFERADHIAENAANLHGRFKVQLEKRITVRNIGNIIAANPQADLIFIDHLHMMTRSSPGMSAKEAIDQVVEEVKTLAIEYDKPVVLLSHVSKTRSGDESQATTADLMGSAGIEQLSDFVIMVNADKEDRKIKYLTLGKSRTKQTVGEGFTEAIHTDGLKILPPPGSFLGAYRVPTFAVDQQFSRGVQ